jgi:vacuolar-type H+-ATPase subunit I/STV1
MWVIWLCNLNKSETKSESGEIVVINDKAKLKTCGAKESYEEAEKFIIPDMKEDQCKEIERVDTIRENFCGKCKHSAKVYHDRVMARMKKDAKVRAIISGDKSGTMASIPDKDYKGYLRFLVENRIKNDYQKEQQRLEKAKEAEAKNEARILEAKKALMEKESKVNKSE